MLLPNTATAGHSIWDSVGRRAFENNLDAFYRTKSVPEAHALAEADWPKERDQSIWPLPFAVEKQLADDFAFIAACDYGVGYVTAATVEPKSEPRSLTVRLAANEGVCDRAKGGIERVIDILQRCARKELSRNRCAEDAFDTVLSFNLNRILGRLKSKFFQRPPDNTVNIRTRAAPAAGLKKSFDSYLSRKRSLSRSAEVRTLAGQIDAFHSSFLQLETSTSDEILGAAKTVIKAAFDITGDGMSLTTRLQSSGIPMSVIDGRIIHEVNKIANYWRICRTFSDLSRSYRLLFTMMRLEILEPYKPAPRLAGKVKNHVHAEVQIAVFYEIHSTPPWPRAIGASKEACFLCNAFIAAHGCFNLSKAHRQIYSLWTVPDLKEYSSGTVERLRRTLVMVNRDITRGLEGARRRRVSRPFPLQSSINLRKVMLPTPSMTTVRSSSSGLTEKALSLEIPTPRRIVTPRPLAEVLHSEPVAMNEVKSNIISAGASIINASPTQPPSLVSLNQPIVTNEPTPSATNPPITNHSSPSNHPPDTAIFPAITSTSPIHITLDGLRLYISLTPAPSSSLPQNPIPSSAPIFSRASVQLAPTSTPHQPSPTTTPSNEAHVDINTLTPGEERVIARPLVADEHEDLKDEAQPQLDFLLQHGERKFVRVSCRWFVS